jgi:hypothetical protein
VPLNTQIKAKRRIGFLDGKFPPMSLEEFNSMDDEIAELFYAGCIFPNGDANHR